MLRRAADIGTWDGGTDPSPHSNLVSLSAAACTGGPACRNRAALSAAHAL